MQQEYKNFCDKHPKYRSKRRPKVDCYECWMEYLYNNPDKDINCFEMFEVLIGLKGKEFS